MKKIISISILILAMFGSFSNEPMVQAQAPPLLLSETTGDLGVSVYLGFQGYPGAGLQVKVDSLLDSLTNPSGYIRFNNLAPGDNYNIFVYGPTGYSNADINNVQIRANNYGTVETWLMPL